MRMPVRLLMVLFLLGVCQFLYAAPLPADTAPQQKAGAPGGNPKSLELNEKGARAMASGDFAQAEELFRKALAVDTGNVTAAFNLSGIYLLQKKQADARTLLEQYLKIYPQDAGLNVRMGDSYFSDRKASEALKYYQIAYKLDPAYTGLASKIGILYAMSRKYEEAEKVLLEAAERNPKDGQLLSNLSSVFLANGKPDMSISTAKRALQINPNSDIYVTLGNAYEQTRDRKNALISFQRAMDLGDTRPELKEKIEQLKKAE